jgi:hypothetical protein
LTFLTAAEEDAIWDNARAVARELFSAIVPVEYETFASAIEKLHQGGLLSVERRDAVLRCQVID